MPSGDKCWMQYKSYVEYQGYLIKCSYQLCFIQSCTTADGDQYRNFIYKSLIFNQKILRQNNKFISETLSNEQN